LIVSLYSLYRFKT